MSMVIVIYSEEYVCEQRLPNMENTDYMLRLSADLFGLHHDVLIPFENISGKWSVQIHTVQQGKPCREQITLTSGMRLPWQIEPEKWLTFVVRTTEADIWPLRKLSLSGLQELRVGRSAQCEICFPEQRIMSGVHGIFKRTLRGDWTLYCQSTNGVYRNGRLEKADEPISLRYGDRLLIAGVTLLYLGDLLAILDRKQDVPCRYSEERRWSTQKSVTGRSDEIRQKIYKGMDEKSWYHRSPRIQETMELSIVEIEEPPQETANDNRSLFRAVGPSVTMALPMLLGYGLMRMAASGSSSLYLYSGLVMTGTSSAFSIFWTVMNQRNQKQNLQARQEKRKHSYLNYLAGKYQDIEVQEQTYRRLRTQRYPGAAVCMKAIEQGTLWERSPWHSDFAVYRFGLGEEKSPVEIQIPKEKFRMETDELTERPGKMLEEYRRIPSMPILLDSQEYSLVGLIGGADREGAAGISLLAAAQMAACNCYTELRMAFLYNGSKEKEKRWFRFAHWLPHVWEEEHGRRWIAENEEEASEIFQILLQILRRRRDLRERQNGEIPLPRIMVFLSGMELLESHPLAAGLLKADPELGITTWILASREEELPNICRCMIVNRAEFRGIMIIKEHGLMRRELVFDHISPEETEEFARKLSGIRVRERRENGAVPGMISFLGLHNVQRVEELRIRERWMKNRTWDHIRGEIGQSAGGELLCLDLHEKYHGPHGLLAGTTGSGKSECLLTLLLSLAVNYSPEELGFFLIDYKGGGMAELVRGLPHVMGSISNLSGSQVRRAMAALKSENRRRQKSFLDAGVNHIGEYTRLYRKGQAAVPIPHLLLVIDEFAELKREEPEFMQELTSVAQVGRSLGVHLILATQKPSGVVDEHIRSNSRFRICLRVQDRQDSLDLLRKPDAAFLTNIGRGYLQVGSDEVYLEFQTGYSGKTYDPEQGNNSKKVFQITNTGHQIHTAKKNFGGERSLPTELEVVLAALIRAANEYRPVLPAKLWLPELPEQLLLSQCMTEKQIPLQTAVGLWDDPENQEQRPYVLRYPDGGSMAILGMASSGKTTFLETLLFGLMSASSPEQLEVWCLDYGNGQLLPLEEFPHVTGVWAEPEKQDLQRIFFHLEQELAHRKKEFSEKNHQRYVESGGKNFPVLLFCVDNYASFREHTEDCFEHILMRIGKEGIALGVFLVITGNGVSMTEIPAKLAALFRTIICMQMKDRFAYGEVFHTMQLPILSEKVIPGRGMTRIGERILEFQTARMFMEGEETEEGIRICCREAAKCFSSYAPKRLPFVPKYPVWDKFCRVFRSEENRAASGLPIGYEEQSGWIFRLHLEHIYCLLISGEFRSGRHNFLCILAHAVKQIGGSSVFLLSSEGHSERVGIPSCCGEEEIFIWFRDVLTPMFRERQHKRNHRLAEGVSDRQVCLELAWEKPLLIGIPDLGEFLQMVQKSDHGICDFLKHLLEKGRGYGIYFAAIIHSGQRNELMSFPLFRLFSMEHIGVCLGGNLIKESVLRYEDLSYQEQSRGESPGVGWFTAYGEERHSRKVILPFLGKAPYDID